jgi:hypothetical protein
MSTTTTDTRRTLQIRTTNHAGTPVVVRGHRFSTTGPWMLTAWEPSQLCSPKGHSTVMSSELGEHAAGTWWGRIGCRRLPADLDALPRGQERIGRVEAWHRRQYREAHQLIVQALVQAGEEIGSAAAAESRKLDGDDYTGSDMGELVVG